jgi:hypothetical protein
MKAVAFEQISRFIRWPDKDDNSNGPERFILGLWGHNIVIEKAEELYTEQRIKDKVVEIRHILKMDDVIDCHLLYIAEEEKDDLSNLVEITRQRPILTISDSPGFIDRGILVNLYIKMNKLRFEVNEQGFHEAGLEIDPLLLKVAEIINPMGGDK